MASLVALNGQRTGGRPETLCFCRLLVAALAKTTVRYCVSRLTRVEAWIFFQGWAN